MPPDEEDGLPRMSLVEHLEELRKRLFYAIWGLAAGMAVAAAYGRSIIHLLTASYQSTMRAAGLDGQLVANNATVGVMTYLNVTLISGLVLASPWIFLQFWLFIGAGLYKRERRFVLAAIPASVLLFIAGCVFFFLVAAEPMMKCFVDFSRWLDIKLLVQLEDHISFMTKLMVVFGLAFQTPLVVLVLVRTGLVTLRTMNRLRRHVIVGLAIFAAVVTPPDIFSQFTVLVPMYLLYELGMVLSYFLGGTRRKGLERLVSHDE